ncbi:MAG: peptidylprolyl isomerase [Candidatus Promineifilaceae bacterium]|nr:peptidylprolyl isomerase [Candidatus Promineifilaceae bacterium]
MTQPRVAPDTVVSLEFQLRLEDGQVVDEATADEPFEYLHGQQSLLPALEQALTGAAPGDEIKVVVAPDDAFGQSSADLLTFLSAEELPDDLDLAVGDELDLHDEQSDEFTQATVAEVRDDGVVLDLNHPLAGETLHFNVRVLAVRPATEEEIDHGHVHVHDHSH